ncbi:helix-turn-helix transcriptional regulator [Prevotella histicola]|uniref:helix-turn-helix domain-containing protein n=1 Tax=Prevotella histicola TaxID=470565 RepID=UPI0028ECD469|nr:helix-turn-helix transcriptional regulator [Prevotella histicola]
MRIKEILKEKGMTLQELADKMDVSRQALSRQVAGKLLVEKAEEIACMLDVPMWQLFVSPEEVAGSGSFVAFVKSGIKTYHANSLSELKKIVQEIKENKE